MRAFFALGGPETARLCVHRFLAIPFVIVTLTCTCLGQKENTMFTLIDVFPELAAQAATSEISIEYLDRPGGALQRARLDKVRMKDGLLQASGAGYTIGFAVKSRERYLVLRVDSVEEPVAGSLMKLAVAVAPGSPLVMTRLDYMAMPSPDHREMHMPWIWARNDANPMGAFAVHAPRDDEAFDENLLNMWVDDGLPHPPGEWTLERAREWLSEWQTRFSDQSCLVISAKNRGELDHMTAWAARIGMKRIYLHTDTWRGEYWPVQHSYLRVNPEVFPRGEQDLNAYTSELRRKGMSFAVHSTCMSIGRSDPDYVRTEVHPELSHWVKGTLERDVTAAESTLYFRPEPGSRMPRMIRHDWAGPDTMRSWFNLKLFMIGHEFVSATSIQKTDTDVWVLEGCQRGAWGKTAAAHKRGAVVTGMTRTYGQAFVPDPDSALFQETIKRWAEFCTRNNVDHLECDALENHQDHPWGSHKFSWLLSSMLTLPSTSNTSSGSPLPFQVEYWFRSSRQAAANHPKAGVAGGASLPLFLHTDERMATGPYEILFKPAEMVGRGGKSFNVSYPWPMFGVTPEILAQHGMVPEVERLIGNWRSVLKSVSDETRATMNRRYALNATPNGARHNQSGTDILFRPEVSEGKRRIVPLRLIGRTGGELKWGFGQEFGPIVPRQFLQLGDSTQLNNPLKAQVPEFIIRVMGHMQEAQTVADATKIATAEDDAILDAYATGTTTDFKVHPLNAAQNFRSTETMGVGEILMPGVSDIVIPEGHAVSYANGVLDLTCHNSGNTLATYADERPSWARSLDMSKARGLGLTVTGDGSGAVLVISIDGRGIRDYVVPIDFTGTREIEIPSGEVAWGHPQWGWRNHSARFDYARIRRVWVGFGTVPPATQPHVVVKNIRPLREVSSAVQDLTITLDSGAELTVPGTIKSDHYLWYRGGDTIGLYDINWNKLDDRAIRTKDFRFPVGPASVQLTGKTAESHPWLEFQFFARGEPIGPGL